MLKSIITIDATAAPTALAETAESLLFGSSVWMRTYRSATAATATDAAGRVRHKQWDSSQTRMDNEMKPLSICHVDLFSHVMAQLSQQFRFKSANCKLLQ